MSGLGLNIYHYADLPTCIEVRVQHINDFQYKKISTGNLSGEGLFSSLKVSQPLEGPSMGSAKENLLI